MKDKRKSFRNRLRHHLHPLHVYCRIGGKRSGGPCMLYEKYIWGWLKQLIERLPDHKEV